MQTRLVGAQVVSFSLVSLISPRRFDDQARRKVQLLFLLCLKAFGGVGFGLILFASVYLVFVWKLLYYCTRGRFFLREITKQNLGGVGGFFAFWFLDGLRLSGGLFRDRAV